MKVESLKPLTTIMYHFSTIWFVNTHSERYSGNHHLYLIIHKLFMCLFSRIRSEASMVGETSHSKS